MEEGRQLATVPRPETTSVSRPEGYIDTESEISKKMKNALAELKELVISGSKVAKKKAKKAQETARRKAGGNGCKVNIQDGRPCNEVCRLI